MHNIIFEGKDLCFFSWFMFIFFQKVYLFDTIINFFLTENICFSNYFTNFASSCEFNINVTWKSEQWFSHIFLIICKRYLKEKTDRQEQIERESWRDVMLPHGLPQRKQIHVHKLLTGSAGRLRIIIRHGDSWHRK